MLRVAWIVTVVGYLAGCATLRTPPPEPEPLRRISSATIRIPEGENLPEIVGTLQRARVTNGDTLLEVARAAGLGFQELQDANPDVDPWVPGEGTELEVPTRWVIPRTERRGIIINLPEMRAYVLPEKTGPGETTELRTWAVGIGRKDWPTPEGPFTVRSKDENPTWYVPESIQKEMEEPRSVVPPGPDNPLGKYRIRTSKPLYLIHGTDTPWAIGRLTTHGCVRLYPEDIEEFFPMAKPGMPGEFLYQPVKLGTQGERIYAEVHRDVYEKLGDLVEHALQTAREAGILERIDVDRLRSVAREARGVPVDVTKGS